MSPALGTVDYVIIVLTLAVCAAVGVFFRFTGGRQKTTVEFLLADKKMSVCPVTFSVIATIKSAVSFLGTPAETYFYGAQMITREFGYVAGTIISAYCIIPTFFEMNCISIYEYLEKRFGKLIRIVTSVLFSLQMLLFMAFVIYAPSLALSTVTGLSVWASILSISLVCMFYSTLGGLKAVLWTDLFQTLLMLLSIYILIIKGSLDIGGFGKMFEIANKGNRLNILNYSIDLTVRYTLWNTFALGLVFGLLLNGTSFTIVQRLLSCGDLKKAQQSLLWTIPLGVLFESGLCLLGVTIYSYYHDCDPFGNKEAKSGDQLVPFFLIKVLGKLPVLPGLCISGIFGAALSSMSSVVNTLAAVTLEDYMKPIPKCNQLKESTKTFVVKIIGLIYGVICLLFTYIFFNTKGLTEAVYIIFGMIGSPTLGTFCLGMFTTSANEAGTLIGLMAGVAINAWIGFGTMYNNSKYPTLPLSTTGCLTHNETSYNELYGFNSTEESLENAKLMGVISTDFAEERYIFPLYRISYLWLSCISLLTTLVVGYAASYVTDFYMD